MKVVTLRSGNLIAAPYLCSEKAQHSPGAALGEMVSMDLLPFSNVDLTCSDDEDYWAKLPSKGLTWYCSHD